MLYIVGTPIGNLDDLSYRQAVTICNAHILLAEDTRSVQIVLQKIHQIFNLAPIEEQHIISYYKEKEFEKLPQVLSWLKDEKDVVLVSESGMPIISDPGYLLVKTAIQQQLPFTIIPGPTAVTTALLHSGFNPQQFMFLGFLPKKKSEIAKIFDKLKSIKVISPSTVFCFYDSPNRINQTLEIIDQQWPEITICICRELTKQNEEIYRGKAHELKNKTYKGEITFLLA
jgi:16S rRNA (cytidine1402-2'-O)-methyltransferase